MRVSPIYLNYVSSAHCHRCSLAVFQSDRLQDTLNTSLDQLYRAQFQCLSDALFCLSWVHCNFKMYYIMFISVYCLLLLFKIFLQGIWLFVSWLFDAIFMMQYFIHINWDTIWNIHLSYDRTVYILKSVTFFSNTLFKGTILTIN